MWINLNLINLIQGNNSGLTSMHKWNDMNDYCYCHGSWKLINSRAWCTHYSPLWIWIECISFTTRFLSISKTLKIAIEIIPLEFGESMHKAASWTLQSREMSSEMRQKPKVLIAFCISYLSLSRLIEFWKCHSCQASSRVRILLLEIKQSTLCRRIASPLNMRANYYWQIYSLRFCHHGARTASKSIHRIKFTQSLSAPTHSQFNGERNFVFNCLKCT